MSESSLIIVSNRLPVTITKNKGEDFSIEHSSGGLVAALRSIHEQSEIVWVGHSGIFSNETGFKSLSSQLEAKRQICVPLQKKIYNAYYNGMSNAAIWPLFHYFPAAMKIALGDFEAYRDVNQSFAEKILSIAKPNDRIWIHDYQLMLLPAILREENKDLQISYFHHIPFPSSEVFRNLPGRRDILKGLLGADYIGFHTYDYVRHFLSAIARILGNDVHVDKIHHEDRIVTVAAHPIGIDFEEVVNSGEKETTIEAVKGIKSNTKIILGIDRLDYTKGIPERLQAYREFLRDNPEFVGKVTFIQHCVPSRSEIQSYGNLRATVERLVGQINGEFAKPGYTPIQYLYRSLPFDTVVAQYKAADVALVTPLRDGLNLVCKEYIAARDDENGVLILSEFAGASSEMGEALLVNPYDIKRTSRAIKKALTMPRAERQRRMQLLRERVEEHDNKAWASAFVSGWKRATSYASPTSQHLIGKVSSDLVAKLKSAERIFLFLDNDGTITPIAARPELAVPSEKVRKFLTKLGNSKNISVTIVTGRPREYCNDFFCDLPINVVAEHGAFVWHKGESVWHSQLGSEEFEDLKPEIMRLLNMYTGFVPGSHIEKKETCFVWHYRQAEPIFAAHQAKELSGALQQLLSNTTLSVYQGKKTVEVRQTVANKGYAVEYFMETAEWNDKDALITVGDDITDEDMHRAYSDRNISIHIGKHNAFAKYFLVSHEGLLDFLEELV